MKIGILATGITSDALLPEFGSYAEMFVTLLKEQDASFEFETFDVRDDVFPDSAGQCDAWLITGSKSNVDERLPWMLRLNDLIRDIDANKQPLVGICFGHQIIADALGGEVARFEGGWGVGIHRYQRVGHDAYIPDHVTSFAICAMHQYQVVDKPERARVFAKSDFCEYAGLLYDNHIFTLQGHPEFNKAYEVALIDMLKANPIPEALSEQGLQSVERETLDSPAVLKWIADFIKQGQRT
ncbi:glutamine amidotransferase-related protein [Marinomonas spartinae]|uniref:glutamine amidotransferase-related protein n=1 Tax=Marinomonas spartinae TaxID=1792290 RepID=UPI0018F24372|nr:glutamine amidotransferase [Marinomonas spartinae]MBJ7554418.1 glutamine amidotransferase [Marinomonas spartinae]